MINMSDANAREYHTPRFIFSFPILKGFGRFYREFNNSFKKLYFDSWILLCP